MRPIAGPRPIPILLAVAILGLPACAHRHAAQPPVAAEPAPAPPAQPAPEPGVDVEAALAAAEEAYQRGLDAYRAGDHEQARGHFEQTLRILAEADPTFEADPRLAAAYRTYWENIQDLESQRAGGEEDPGPASPVGTPADALEEISPELGPDAEARERGRAAQAASQVTYDVPMVLDESVLAFVDLYTGEWRELFEAAYRRSGRYEAMIRREFAEQGLPQDLAYMAHVESGFKPRALSRARAYGLWQFMAATGRTYGLRRDTWVDERADPEKATRAAAAYLRTLHDMFGDWHLAMAAYNAGEHKVDRAIRYTRQHNFWGLRQTRYLRRETKNFVPAILAAILIYRSPEKYGFDPSTREEPMRYDLLRVDSQTDLSVLSEVSGTSREEIRLLNPALRRDTTPPGDRDYLLRLPPGSGEAAQVRLAAIPRSERIRQVVHVVRAGETLSLLADRYGTSVAAIQAANRIANPRRVRVGSELVIPLAGGAPPARAAVEVDGSTGLRVHVVERGENPYLIAREHGLRLADLLAWNGLDRSSIIHPGARLYVQDPGGEQPAAAPPARAAGATVHVVRSGETAVGIAGRYGIPLDDLLAANGLTRRSVIHPGQRLVVGGGDGAADAGDPLIYVVRRGDTLYEISRAHSVSVADLCRWNGISARTVLYPGDRLRIHLP